MVERPLPSQTSSLVWVCERGMGYGGHTEDVLVKRLQAPSPIMRLAGGGCPSTCRPWLLQRRPQCARKALHGSLMPGFAQVCDAGRWSAIGASCQHHADAPRCWMPRGAVRPATNLATNLTKTLTVDWQWACLDSAPTGAARYAALEPPSARRALCATRRDVDTPIRFAEPLLGPGPVVEPTGWAAHESPWFHHADPDAVFVRLHTPFYQPAVWRCRHLHLNTLRTLDHGKNLLLPDCKTPQLAFERKRPLTPCSALVSGAI